MQEQTVGDGELDVCVSTAPPKAEVLPPEELKPPQQLEWDPRGRVWMLDVARQVVRRTPALLQFKTFLEVRQPPRQKPLSERFRNLV